MRLARFARRMLHRPDESLKAARRPHASRLTPHATIADSRHRSGLAVTGFGVLDKTGQKLTYVTSGCIRTRRTANCRRASRPSSRAGQVIARDQAAAGRGREGVRQRQSAIHLAARPGARRGDLRRGHHDCRSRNTPRCRSSRPWWATATRARSRCRRWCGGCSGLPGDPSADAADALACAICHAHGGQGLGQLATARLSHEAREAGVIGRITGQLIEKRPAAGPRRRARASATKSTCR